MTSRFISLLRSQGASGKKALVPLVASLTAVVLLSHLCSAERIEYRGLYTNQDYGFTVRIPRGLVAVGATAGAPNHGFVLNLAEGSQIEVSAFYVNPDDHVPFPSELPRHFPVRTPEGEIQRATFTRLGGMRAQRTLTAVVTPRGATRVTDKVVAVRNDKDGNPYIRYTVTLMSESKPHSVGTKVFSSVLRSFQLTSVH